MMPQAIRRRKGLYRKPMARKRRGPYSVTVRSSLRSKLARSLSITMGVTKVGLPT
jgi:hypothetical protein